MDRCEIHEERLINPWRMFYGAMIPDWLLSRKDISPATKMVYAKLCQYAGKNGVAFPKKRTLAAAVGMTKDRVDLCLSELQSKGLIQTTQRRVSGYPNKPNEYRFLEHPYMCRQDTYISHTDCEDEEYQAVSRGEGGEKYPPRGVKNGGLGGWKSPLKEIESEEVDSVEIDSSYSHRADARWSESAEAGDIPEDIETNARDSSIRRLTVIAGGKEENLKQNQEIRRTTERTPPPARGTMDSILLSVNGISENDKNSIQELVNDLFVGDDSHSMADLTVEERIRIAREKLAASGSRAVQITKEKAEKRLERERQQELRTGMTKEQRKRKAKETRMLSPDRQSNAKDVESWFADEMESRYPNITNPKWDIKELTFGKRLLVQYGAPLTLKVIEHVFQNWEQIRKDHPKSKLGIVPTIQWLYGWRKNLFAEVENMQAPQKQAVGSKGPKFW